MRVGVAGFGKMGSAMAMRLRESETNVLVWSRNGSIAQEAGFSVAASPKALAAECDLVITSLFDASAVYAVYEGPEGLIAGCADTLFVEMSTLAPATQRALSHAVACAGGSFLECPVSGTTGPARAGQLLGLVGGNLADVDRARPLLSKLCRRIEHIGDVGAASTAKLAINLPLLAFWQSFGEAVALMRKLGMSPTDLVALFGETAGAPAVLKVKAQAVVATLAGSDTVAPTYDIDAMRKDLGLMLEEARAGGFSIPVAQAILASLDEAASAGWGMRDCAWVPAYWASKAT